MCQTSYNIIFSVSIPNVTSTASSAIFFKLYICILYNYIFNYIYYIIIHLIIYIQIYIKNLIYITFLIYLLYKLIFLKIKLYTEKIILQEIKCH